MPDEKDTGTRREETIDREIERTLGTLEEAPRLSADPLFTTRLMARIGAEEGDERKRTMVFSLLRAAVLLILLGLNLFMVYESLGGVGGKALSRETCLQACSRVYMLDAQETNLFMY